MSAVVVRVVRVNVRVVRVRVVRFRVVWPLHIMGLKSQ